MKNNIINLRKNKIRKEISNLLFYFILNIISLLVIHFFKIKTENNLYVLIKLIPFISSPIIEFRYLYLNIKYKINILVDEKEENQKKIYKQYFKKYFFKFFLYKLFCFVLIFVSMILILLMINILIFGLFWREQIFWISLFLFVPILKGFIIFCISLLFLIKKFVTIEEWKYWNTITEYPDPEIKYKIIYKKNSTIN